MKDFTVLGLMSGTSMDGLDCGLFNISLNHEYELEWSCIDFMTCTYLDDIRKSILKALSGDDKYITITDEILGAEFERISIKFLNGRHIDMISSHGQTIAHSDGKSTLQIGNLVKLHNRLRVPAIYNVRQADIETGGNGAPLMPFLDWLLYKNIGQQTITLNIGGVANISFIPESGKRDEVIGFDTGPGMALIDECCKKYYGETMDENGAHSMVGRVNETILAGLMNYEFIRQPPPKSTGRHEFGPELLHEIIQQYPDISPDDLLRTFCIFTAQSIAENLDKFLNISSSGKRLIISGGGVHHPVLMKDIQNYCGIKDILISDKLGIKSDLKEALLMAVLGVARMQKMPANMPSVTGAREEVILGDIIR